jgi:hypothetical protein
MAIVERELENTLLKKISIDEFEPKTGSADKVMVVGFYVINDSPGDDLYRFINNSIIEIRDVEVSPNPDEDNYYMVFVELDRKDDSIKTFKELIKEVELVAGELDWQVKSMLMDEPMSINDSCLDTFIQTDPDNYLTKDEFLELQQEPEDEVDQLPVDQEEVSKLTDESIMRFLKDTALLEATIDNNILTIGDSRNRVALEIVELGRGKKFLKDVGLHEAAIDAEYDRPLFSKLSRMLGSLEVLQINEHVVLYNPRTENILVTKRT